MYQKFFLKFAKHYFGLDVIQGCYSFSYISSRNTPKPGHYDGRNASYSDSDVIHVVEYLEKSEKIPSYHSSVYILSMITKFSFSIFSEISHLVIDHVTNVDAVHVEFRYLEDSVKIHFEYSKKIADRIEKRITVADSLHPVFIVTKVTLNILFQCFNYF